MSQFNVSSHCYYNFVFITVPNPPENIKITNICSTSVTLTWEPPASIEKTYRVVCHQDSKTVHQEATEANTLVINNLTPGKKYSFHIATVLKNGSTSKIAMSYASTRKYLSIL